MCQSEGNKPVAQDAADALTNESFKSEGVGNASFESGLSAVKNESPAAAAARRRVAAQMKHVAGEVARNEAAQLSLQHLSLFDAFLARENVAAVCDEDVALDEQRDRLVKAVSELVAAHPHASEAPSGDTEAAQADGWFRFAPLVQPLRRYGEKLSVWWLNFFTLYPAVLVALACLYHVMGGALFCTVLAGYYAHVWWTDKACQRPWHGEGSGQQPWLRKARIYDAVAGYFPMRAVRYQTEGAAVSEGRGDAFDRKGGYLFGVHPHGVQTVSVYAYLTDAAHISSLFSRPLQFCAETLAANFWVPFIREYAVALGFGNASRESIARGLTHAENAAVVLVVGGAKESLFSAPHSSKVALQGRFGFLKVAFQTGAAVVPCWTFGETSLFDNAAATSPRVSKVLRAMQKYLTFAPLMVHGRGVFNYSFGVVPYRRPVTSVVGEPILCEKTAAPTKEQLAAAHAQYVAQLREMVDLYRDIYEPDAEDLCVM
eukprot:TRINITY_DN2817_c0_g1_i2.p1 TRINITY_DN2817_c0_g1~~TRINITY_DN2817_c0_g1_i2.p1  ORF type:complete len:487 (+),score=168.11 TRINITY_DN2817_c0_g1_i2:76-1536(+)